MDMDFSKLGSLADQKLPTDPIRIFESLPNLPGTPNDIWRGQTEALSQWNDNRSQNDVLIELNTGAGKTLVGLLIAQSLVNEGLQNVVYVCATIDLVEQTSAEASRIGIQHTTRVAGGYNNDLFESGKAFCITTYHALFNGLSSIRKNHFPEAVIFDDAHVSENMIRSAMTLSFSEHTHEDMFEEVASLFDPHFRELGRHGEFSNALKGEHSKIVMAAPGGMQKYSEQLLEILNRHNIGGDKDLKYPFSYLQDRLNRCAIFFGNKGCEITPPFLPSLRIDCLERPLRRVYLSATLKSKADFVRAYGRMPDATIGPKNDAGNGERLVLFGSKIEGGVGVKEVEAISGQHKVVLATPSYFSAHHWDALGKPPKPANFSSELQDFREAKEGVFILVQRVDGIDLPHNTCRVMVIENLPRGGSLLERYQWEFLNMRNLFASKMANRLAQLFGRINRGRNDYGVFIITGNELNTWLKNDRNLALLPELLQQQIKLGDLVQDGMAVTSAEKLTQIVNAVLGRDAAWLKYYGDNIQKGSLEDEKEDRANRVEERLTAAAVAESEHACLLWDGDLEGAGRALDRIIEDTNRADTPLAGWHSIWLGSCYEGMGSRENAAIAYQRAKNRLGSGNVYLPLYTRVCDAKGQDEPFNDFGEVLDSIIGYDSEDKFEKELNTRIKGMRALDGGSSAEVEAALRELGDLLGFDSTRPDNDQGLGPDVIWADDHSEVLIPFELKTDKTMESVISKKDVGQGHQHQEWVADNYHKFENLGLVYVSAAGSCDATASPSEDMYQCDLRAFATLRDQVLSMIRDIRNRLPLERANFIRESSSDDRWLLNHLFDAIDTVPLRSRQPAKK
ncbi:DEAD/DEAH box helicase family protein [Marinobacter sp. HL-58]|uniref:DEAD/DEAH box helicase family protein n=1 Tax=Marinobacter sp. HL-58 TaxID=1479237 RepID=UPI0006DB9493|nr:DEAD/DEAH box helicase family protein [Marinobacter sp. HL-58]KPQ01695.1 MAG: Superfamily II helicase [Marinobacter sp. HL-58]